MAGHRIKLRCLDRRGVYFPRLPSYPNGIELNYGDEFKVTEKEAKFFLRQENGHKKIYEEVKTRARAKPDEIITEENNE